MQLKTKKEPVARSNKEKINDLRVKHQELFVSIGAVDALFFPKMAYMGQSKEKIISFFPSEISRGEDIYTEFVSRDYESEDPQRKLYKWKFNPFYETEYATTPPHPVTGDIRYEIPIDELIEVTNGEGEVAFEVEDASFSAAELDAALPNAEVDLPLSEMTMRDYAAIHLGKPVSRKAWLNEVINSKL
jgi:hypothetical protein